MRTLLLLPLVACGDSRIDLGSLKTADDIVDACSQKKPKELEVPVVFEAQTETCPWGEDDNAAPNDGLFAARVEQVVSLDLPENAVICDMVLDLSGLVPGEVQLMVYDDHFFFNFNDVILASSSAYAVDRMEQNGTLRTWDWADAVGFDYHYAGQEHPSYCLGEEEGLAECDIPQTETEGAITMSFDEDLVAELSFAAIGQSRFDFAFVTVGDDDPDLDCKHEEFGFNVTVPYLNGG